MNLRFKVDVFFSYYWMVFALYAFGIILDELWTLNFLFNLYDFFLMCWFTCCYLLIYIRRHNLCLTVTNINLIFICGFMPNCGGNILGVCFFPLTSWGDPSVLGPTSCERGETYTRNSVFSPSFGTALNISRIARRHQPGFCG